MKRVMTFSLLILLFFFANSYGAIMKNKQYVINQWIKMKQESNGVTLQKDRYGYEIEMLSRILKDDLNQKERNNLLTEILLGDSEEDNLLIQGLIICYSDIKDEDSLIDLLSKRCPEKIYLNSKIEFYLAFQCKDNFKEPISILFKAFKISNDQNTRKNLIDAIKRAFCVNKIYSNNDNADLIVNKVEKWYNFNKDRISPDIEYFHNYMRGKDVCEVGLFLFN